MPLIRSISGVRATLGDALTPFIVAEYTAAFASYLPPGIIVVGRDGRPSGEWIEKIVCATLAASGREVLELGIVPTPTVQLFAEHQAMAGGISISASHNPVEWNGLKFLNNKGMFLSAEENAQFWQCLDERQFAFVPNQHGESMTTHQNPAAHHTESIMLLPLFSNSGNVELIRNAHFRVVVDAVNAAGSHFIPYILKAFGCEVIPLYCDGTGIFPHTPEPIPEHLGDLSKAVVEHHADFGIAVDPDADRLVLVDERGRVVFEENTVVLATLAVLRNKQYFGEQAYAPVVVNMSTTQAVEDIAAHYGVKVIRTAVGEINVVQGMLEHGSIIGGEGSGGVILPTCHAGRDSLVGTALILLLLAQVKQERPNMTLSSIVSALPRYCMIKHKQPFHGDVQSIATSILKRYPDAIANTEDGLRLSFADGWIHLRTSNTEPIIRLIVEAKTQAEAERLASTCLAVIRDNTFYH
ncbi:MAG: phosphoglucosamine mutase [Bacteroidota bacterium]|nr:phosphoglucosamine mutase [Candidatus Kapabacteria bacterium]MDW8219376.1 phosphoglucosamine mutase [Bacteroidota bacterium]